MRDRRTRVRTELLDRSELIQIRPRLSQPDAGYDILMAGPSRFMKAYESERRQPFELPAHKSNRGKRDAERLVTGRNESESRPDISLDEPALFFVTQAVVKKAFSHPLNRLPSMGGEDEHPVWRQMVGKKTKEVRPLLRIQVREEGSTPNQVETPVEVDAPDILMRIKRRCVEVGSTEFRPVTVEIAGH